MKSAISSYVNLTKPTIVLLFSLTGLTAIVLEGSLLHDPLRLGIILLAITLTAGSANSLNMFFDRDIDEIMKRTRLKRSIPNKKVEPINALRFGILLGVLATGLLLWVANPLTAFLGVFTIFFYVVIYTLYLKRRTPYNIVIGGAAGAMAPLMGWAAATNHISMTAWILFLIVFMWTPPHFWALALVIKEDYRQAKVPMLPVVAGDSRTRIEIQIYSILLIPLTLAPVLVKAGGKTYLISGIVLGLIFLRQAFVLLRRKDNKSAYILFGYSIVYLLLLFILLMIGTLINV
jgi:protoheme IX farnesyltransferase